MAVRDWNAAYEVGQLVSVCSPTARQSVRPTTHAAAYVDGDGTPRVFVYEMGRRDFGPRAESLWLVMPLADCMCHYLNWGHGPCPNQGLTAERVLEVHRVPTERGRELHERMVTELI